MNGATQNAPTEDELAEGLLLLASSVIERLLLVRRTLASAASDSPRVRPVVDLLTALTTEVENKNNWSLVRRAYRWLTKRRGHSHSFQAFKSAVGVLENASSQATNLHQYMSLLPTAEAPQVMLSALEQAFPHHYRTVRPVVILLPDLSYYEIDFAARVRADPVFKTLTIPPEMSGRVIRVSIVDADAPLSWPALAHELGHAIAQHEGLDSDRSSRLRTALGEQIPESLVTGLFDRYCNEFLCDLIAAAGIGPGVILTLLRFEMFSMPRTDFLPISTVQHPSAMARLVRVTDFLGESSFRPFKRTIEGYRTLRAIWFREHPNELAYEATLETLLFPKLAEIALGEMASLGLDQFDTKALMRSSRLAHRMERQIPPAAVRWVDKAVAKPALRYAIAREDKTDFRAALDSLRERVASPAEIITCGLLRREECWYPCVEGSLREGDIESSWEAWTEPLRTFLNREDDLLRAGLASSQAHAHFMEVAESLAKEPVVAEAPTRYHLDSDQVPIAPSGLLSDTQIALGFVEAEERRIYATPLIDPKTQIGSSSIDLRLGSSALVVTNANLDCFDPAADEATCADQLSRQVNRYDITMGQPLVLHPGEFALAASLEYVQLPRTLAGRLEGRSSFGRAGLLVHATAGFIDPGYKGYITFELSNAGKLPIKLYPGVRVAQLSFFVSDRTLIAYYDKSDPKYYAAKEALLTRLYKDDEYRWYRDLIKRRRPPSTS